MNAADPDSDRGAPRLPEKKRSGGGAIWKIVDPASLRHRPPPRGKKRGQ